MLLAKHNFTKREKKKKKIPKSQSRKIPNYFETTGPPPRSATRSRNHRSTGTNNWRRSSRTARATASHCHAQGGISRARLTAGLRYFSLSLSLSQRCYFWNLSGEVCFNVFSFTGSVWFLCSTYAFFFLCVCVDKLCTDAITLMAFTEG